MSLSTPRPAPATYAVTLIVPLVTIVGLIVLIALHDIQPAAGLGLIGGLAGLHGGVAVSNVFNK